MVDVDSAGAAAVLRDRLPHLPATWAADSGSADPDRRHYYFRLPAGLPAAASLAPWHPRLEFRGAGGLINAPPSLHASGRRYRWRAGRSPHDVPLAPLPDAIAAEFRRHGAAGGRRRAAAARPAAGADPPAAMTAAHRLRVEYLPDVCRATREFLLGDHADGPGWNRRLFNAACDLAGAGRDGEWAEAALLLGAAPWDAAEERKALATIASAFSRPRTPVVDRPPLAARLTGRAAR